MLKKLLLIFFLFTSVLFGDKITIFAASDLKFALDNIKSDFIKSHPNAVINMIYGSSGKGRVQIQRGAPYDIYFSANMDYVNYLYKKGKISTTPKLYAIGRLVIWSKNSHFDIKKGFKNFTQKWIKNITIANPAHAPYGQKAKQALLNRGIYNKIKSKIVFGENISQTANYINMKAADIGIIALSIVLSPEIKSSKYHNYYLIDKNLYKPLKQGYAITKYGQNSQLAHQFYDFFQTKKAQKIMKKYGFTLK